MLLGKEICPRVSAVPKTRKKRCYANSEEYGMVLNEMASDE